jgi:hypothetical protein
MNDPYTGYLQLARDMTAEVKQKRRRDDEDRDPNERQFNPDDNNTPDQAQWECQACGEPATDGYLAPCCGKLCCQKCIQRRRTQGEYDWMFIVLHNSGLLRCAWCNHVIDRNDTRLLAVPPDALPQARTAQVVPPPPPPPGPEFVQSDELAWNLVVLHRCGSPMSLEDWPGCDLIAGGCRGCGQQPLVIVPTGGHNTFAAQNFWDNGLKPLQATGTPESFAALRTAHPELWQLLRLSALVAAVAGGTVPDLSTWPSGARALLLSRAADIHRLLS